MLQVTLSEEGQLHSYFPQIESFSHPLASSVVHMHDGDWENILKEVQSDIPGLVDDFIADFSSLGSYGNSPVSEKELRHTAFEVLTMLMEAIAGPLDDTTFRQHADTLGRRRAQQGVPISTLIDAVQLDFLVIWNRIRQAAGGNQEVLISHVDQLHNTVAKYNFFVRDGFRRENARIAQDLRLSNARHLDKLFSSTSIDTITIEEIAQAIGCDAHSNFKVVVFHANSALKARDALDLATAEGKIFGYPHDGLFTAFWPLNAENQPDIPALPSAVFGKVEGLANVRDAVLASPKLFEASCTPTQPTPAHELSWAIAGSALAAFPGSKQNELSADIAKLRNSNSPALETVEAYLRTGSIKQTAAISYCHRNTVINRLSQFADTTGYDVTRPYEAAAVILALRHEPSSTFRTSSSSHPHSPPILSPK
ncbi:helix-turn-helix domain-containing protein [Corynebacterium striatum]